MGRVVRTVALAVALGAVGCSRSDRAAPASPPVQRAATLLEFTGTVDVEAGTVTLAADAPASALRAALTEVPVVQDGVAGSGPPGTVELVTLSATTMLGGCGAVDGYEGVIRLQSFFADAVLTNAHIELLSVTPTGRELCNSAPPIPGTSDQYGLVSYGSLSRAGITGDSATAAWRFRLPEATSFTFRGRVVADRVTADALPPVSTLSRAAGTVPAGTAIGIGCVDAETGCAAVHYTLDGSAPTTGSPIYAAPIPVDADLTLRWFAVDRFGNAEAPRSAAFVLDAVAPGVVVIDPADGASDVPDGALVAVTFSEPMDVATAVAAISLEGPAGVVAGTVSPDAAGAVFTLTPDAPLVAGAAYVVRVAASATDLAGNPLPAERTAGFATKPPWDVVSGTGSATLRTPNVAYDASGNGLAVWAAGSRVYYAYFSASAGTWGSATLLSEAPPTIYQGDVRVAASDTAFMVAWWNTTTLRAALFTGGVPGAATDVYANHPPDGRQTFGVASNGTGFAVAGIGGSSSPLPGLPYARFHDGTAWTGFRAAGHYGYTATNVAIAPLGAQYRLLFLYSANVMVTDWDGSAWTYETSVGNPADPNYPMALAVSSTRTCIAGVGAAGAAPWAYVITPPFSGLLKTIGTAAASGVDVAISGSRCAAVAATSTGPLGVVYNGSSFSNAVSLVTGTSPSDAVAVAPVADTGFAAVSRVVGASTELRLSATSAWAWTAGFSVPFEDEAAVPRSPRAAAARVVGPARFAYLQPDAAGDRVVVRALDGTALGTPEVASGPAPTGSVSGLSMVANAAGDLLVAWTQEDLGTTQVFARFRVGGVWGFPEKLAAGASVPIAATNGMGFAVAYRVGTQAVARSYDAGAWTAPLTIGTGLPMALASDGTGYAVALMNATTYAPWGSVFHGGAWSAPTALAAAGSTSYHPTVAGRAGEYLFAWDDRTSSYVNTVQSLSVRWSGSAWTWYPRAQLSDTTGSQGPVIAAGPGGFGVTWTSYATSQQFAVVSQSGVWGAVRALRSCSGGGVVGVASNGSSYVFASQCNGLAETAWVAGSWGALRTVDATIDEFDLEASGSDYAFLYRVDDQPGNLSSTHSIAYRRLTDPAAGTLTAPLAVESSPEETGPGLLLTWDGSAFVGGWLQLAPGSLSVYRALARGGL